MSKKYAFVVGIDSQWITEAKQYFASGKDKLFFTTDAGFRKLPYQRVYFKLTPLKLTENIMLLITQNLLKLRVPTRLNSDCLVMRLKQPTIIMDLETLVS